MLNSGILAFDGTGRIRNRQSGIPTDFNGGTPTFFANGGNLLCTRNAVAEAYCSGAPYRASFDLCAQVALAVDFAPGGLPLDATGIVAADLAGAITFLQCGTALHGG